MAQLYILRRGERIPLTSRSRGSAPTRATQSVSLLGEDVVQMSLRSAQPLDFEIGDQIEAFGRVYTLHHLPEVKKTGRRQFDYSLTFEGVQYELIDALWLLPPEHTTGDAFTGTATDWARLIVRNAQRIAPQRWKLGETPTGEEVKTLSYEGKNTLEVLQDVCEQFATEFEIEQSGGVCTLHLRPSGSEHPYTFRYGRGRGLYQLQRKSVEGRDVVTRLYVWGGAQNLPEGYRAQRLCLPLKGRAQSYLEEATALSRHGIKEGSKTFDDVYPARYGVVSGVGAKAWQFVDSDFPFDLNAKGADGVKTLHLIPGVTAKVHFTTGNLAGYEFDLSRYDHSTKTFSIIPETDPAGLAIPSETAGAFQIKAGDKYFLTDIRLPEEYVREAEARLEALAREHYAQHSAPSVSYSLVVDEAFLRQWRGGGATPNIFWVGDSIKVEDADLGVDRSLRIQSLTRDLLQPYRYTLTLSDVVERTAFTRVVSELKRVDQIIRTHRLDDEARARRTQRTTQELLGMVFDPEGSYYSEKIKPLSIETTSLSVGARAGQFSLVGVVFSPNHEGRASVLGVSEGDLLHYNLGVGGTPRRWHLSGGLQTLEHPDRPYYIYARVEREGTAGAIVLDTQPRALESDPTHWHLPVGILHSEADGVRAISLTYGATLINGGHIRTGRIQSADGSSYFDLDGNAFKLGDEREGLSWNAGGSRRLVLSGALVQSRGGQTAPLGVYLGAWSAETLYSKGDEVSYEGSTYRYKSTEARAGIQPTDAEHWDVVASKGERGDKGADGARGADGKAGPSLVYRGDFAEDVVYYSNDKRRDVVRHEGHYYMLRPEYNDTWDDWFDPERWESFGAQFESVATRALYAETINADKLRVRRLWGGDDDDASPRLYARGKELSFYLNATEEKKDEGYSYGGHASVRIGIGVGMQPQDKENKPGILAQDPPSAGFPVYTPRHSELSSGGVFSNGSLIRKPHTQADRYLSGFASVVGILKERDNRGSATVPAVSAAVVGVDETTDPTTGNTMGFGGWFEKLHAGGVYVSVRAIDGDDTHEVRTVKQTDVWIIANTRRIGGFCDVVLPAKPYAGQLIFIKRNTFGKVYILGNGHKISTDILQDRKETSSVGDTSMLIFDGNVWHYNHIYR